MEERPAPGSSFLVAPRLVREGRQLIRLLPRRLRARLDWFQRQDRRADSGDALPDESSLYHRAGGRRHLHAVADQLLRSYRGKGLPDQARAAGTAGGRELIAVLADTQTGQMF